MGDIIYYVLAILLFGVFITIHELGHFLAARACGIRVNEFAIGMGPAVFKRQGKSTLFSLRAFPIGGYCAMEGEGAESDAPDAFGKAARWKRFIVLAAGSLMNFLLGVLIIFLLMLPAAGGDSYDATVNGIESVLAGASFEGAILPGDEILEINGNHIYMTYDISMFLDRGKSMNVKAEVLRGGEEITLKAKGARIFDLVQDGDEVISVNGENVISHDDARYRLERASGKYYDITVKRNGERITLRDVHMERREFDGEPRYGIVYERRPVGFASSIRTIWYTSVDYLRMVRMGLFDLLSGQAGVNELQGPVGIVSEINRVGQETAKKAQDAGAENPYWFAFLSILSLGAFMTINLSFMNLLPIPGLDGGRIAFLLVESVRRKPLKPQYEGYVNLAGFALLICLILYVSFNDILRLVQGLL